MDTLSYKTISANKATAQKEWIVVVDTTDLVLGRMGSKVAKLLRGKIQTKFTPHVDCGDNVIIINAEKYNSPVTNGPTEFIFVTPDIPVVKAKWHQQNWWKKSWKNWLKVVKGMLPKNKLGAKLW